MALKAGDPTATSGMTQTIYEQIRAQIEPSLGEMNANDLETIQTGWKKLSYAIAKGVIDHIKQNMEIHGIETKGNISADIKNNKATQNDVVFSQSDDGKGHVS